jgi:hypothetical protein
VRRWGSWRSSWRLTRRKHSPFVEEPPQVLAAHRGEAPLPQQIVTKLRQGPPTGWQAQRIRRNVGQPPHVSELRPGDPLGCSTPTQVLHRCHSVQANGMEIRIAGIDMYIQHLGDVSSRQVSGIE